MNPYGGLQRFAGIGKTTAGIREQDRMDALAVMRAMDSAEYRNLGDIAERAGLTPPRTRRVLDSWPSLVEHRLGLKPYHSNGRTKQSQVYQYRRTSNAIDKVRSA